MISSKNGHSEDISKDSTPEKDERAAPLGSCGPEQDFSVNNSTAFF